MTGESQGDEELPLAPPPPPPLSPQPSSQSDEDIASCNHFADASDSVKYLQLKLRKMGCVNCDHFRNIWRELVPDLLSPAPDMDYLSPQGHLQEDLISSRLLQPLSAFLCQNESPSDFLRDLSSRCGPPSTCGKRFKMGEAAYTCVDCGIDHSCVLCAECFSQSLHRGHKYKMGTSNGGGYCDCGDSQAWRKDPYCEKHFRGISNQDQTPSDPIESIPSGLRPLMTQTLTSILRYAHDILTLDTYLSDHAIFKKQPQEELYSLVVYNDEIHGFDDVIYKLPRAVDCDRSMAVGLATLIDGEGRALVKCGPFQECFEAKKKIERSNSRRETKPLRVVIMPNQAIAHQNFALRLLDWIQELLGVSDGFKALFSDAMLAKEGDGKDPSLVESFFRHDTILWKQARGKVHHLLLSGMLYSEEAKLKFARLFTRCYGMMMKDFILDDQHHSSSITSLTLQLFSVPSLAHKLISEDDVFANVLQTFISECERRRNERGKIEFPRMSITSAFVRSHYILHDIKYLLTMPPDVWNDNLRKGFLHGLDNLLKVLSWMQGMDSQVRQTSRHLEFELRWDSAFHLQMKLNLIISSIYKWVATDRVVFIKAVRLLFKALERLSAVPPEPRMRVMVSDQVFEVIDYQVSSRPISIHFPVTRMLAGFCLLMEKFELSYASSFFDIESRPDALGMIELPLRTMALVAQVQAGMWRLNGDSLSDQLRTYHLPSCCGEMFDKDIIMLQWGAALLDPDQLIVLLLNKYGLVNWASPDFDFSEEDSIHQIITLVEDLFITLIFILGERYKPGVGEISPEKALEREIIQLLCVGPLSFSSIVKSLPDGHHREASVEKIIQTIATFKKPTSTTGKGYFELKADYHAQYNVFYYHYSREEHSKSEEAQRKQKSLKGQPECNPPPPPPSFSPFFARAERLLRSRLLSYLMSLVLKRADNLKSRCFSENQVHRVLHLIGLCLYEQERYAHRVGHAELFTTKASEFNVLELLEQLGGNQRIASHRDLLHWVIKLWKKTMSAEEMDVDEGDKENNAESSSASAQRAEELKRQRAEMAKVRRLKLMAQMKSAQVKFMQDNAEEMMQQDGGSQSKEEENSSNEEEAAASSNMILGSTKHLQRVSEGPFTCILCQEEEASLPKSEGSSPLVMAALIQKSTVLWKRRVPSLNSMTSAFPDEKNKLSRFPLLTSDLSPSPHISSCGHIMHSACWTKYHGDILSQERLRSRMRNLRGFDVDKGEFLCPLCRCINNTVIPLIPRPKEEISKEKGELGFNAWIHGLEVALRYKKKLNTSETQREIGEEEEVGAQEEEEGVFYYTCPLDQVLQEITPSEAAPAFAALFSRSGKDTLHSSSSSISDMANLFANFTATSMGISAEADHFEERKVLWVWSSIAYTIHSTIWSLREQGKSLFGSLNSRLSDCLKSLVSFGGVIASGSHRIVRSHALRLLSIILEGSSEDGEHSSIFQLDAFGLLVSLTYVLPSLFIEEKGVTPPSPIGDDQDLNALRLLFLFHTVQIFLTKDEFSHDERALSQDGPALRLLKATREAVGFTPEGLEGLSEASVIKDLKEASLPFMRCAVLFYMNLTCVSTEAHDAPPSIENEFDRLSHFLGFNLEGLLKSPCATNLAVRWARHPSLRKGDLLASSSLSYPLSINRLVDLPREYCEFINIVASFKCPKSICEDSRYPAMCLICGQVLCSQSYCCQSNVNGLQVGACIAHAHECAGGFGVFLRVRECKVIIISGQSRGCIIDPPYVDQYGETDLGFRRGNPLSLSLERYREINKIWLTHGIPEEISYSLETAQHFMDPPWQDL